MISYAKGFLTAATDAVTVDPNSGKIGFSGFASPKGGLLGLFGTAANVLIFVTASISVIMVIIGGLLYVLSAGNPSSTKRAKDTVLYAVIGFGVALAAFAIISFVNGAVK